MADDKPTFFLALKKGVDFAITSFRALPDLVKEGAKRVFLSTLILTVLTQLATYVFAIRHGARLPLEGVPFLILVALVAGAVLSVISVSTLALIPLGRDYRKGSKSDMVTDQRLDTSKALSTWLIVALSVLLVLTLVLRSLNLEPVHDPTSNLLVEVFGVELPEDALTRDSASSLLDEFWVVMAASILAFAIFTRLRLFTVKALNNISKWGYNSAITMVGLSLFIGPGYPEILRITKFGGGVEIGLTTRDEDLNKAYLFLISSDQVTVWLAGENEFRQFNTEHVVSINYRPDAPYRLPRDRWSPFSASAGEGSSVTEQVQDLEGDAQTRS